jgi:hypothetical protein
LNGFLVFFIAAWYQRGPLPTPARPRAMRLVPAP